MKNSTKRITLCLDNFRFIFHLIICAYFSVKFPENVLWLSLEFDPRCGTAQEEDVLKIYVPDFSTKDHQNKTRKVYRPLPRTYGNDKHAWPGTAIILPGICLFFCLL